jgi:putative addiction module component (TIGR02574 family)
MDFAATLAQIATLPVDQRLKLVQAIWDGIAAEEALPGLSDDQKRELDRRVAELDSNPDDVLTWEQIKARVRR